MPRKKKHNDYGTGIPLHVVEDLVEVLYPAMVEFYKCPDNQRKYEEWLKQQESEGKDKART